MSEPRRNEVALVALRGAAEAGHLHVYWNWRNQPRAFCDHPAYPSMDRPLYSLDFRGWCMNFIYDERGLLVSRRELDPVLDLLAGRYLQNRVATATEPELLEVLQKEPVVAAVVEFMDAKETPQEFMMKGLWEELHRFARERGLLRIGRRNFPGGANVLSRQLGKFEGVLHELGINIDGWRDSNGKHVVLTRRSDGSALQSSVQSSADNSLPVDDLNPDDDRE